MSKNRLAKLKQNELKDKVCRNDYQKAVWDFMKKKQTHVSSVDFWIFLVGFDACISMGKKDYENFKKIKDG